MAARHFSCEVPAEWFEDRPDARTAPQKAKHMREAEPAFGEAPDRDAKGMAPTSEDRFSSHAATEPEPRPIPADVDPRKLVDQIFLELEREMFGDKHETAAAEPSEGSGASERHDELVQEPLGKPAVAIGPRDAEVQPFPDSLELESTQRLDRNAVRLATAAVAAAGAAQEPTGERLAEASYHERLEVSTSLPEQPSLAQVPSAIVTRDRSRGFFATIGAFVARLLHLDDR